MDQALTQLFDEMVADIRETESIAAEYDYIANSSGYTLKARRQFADRAKELRNQILATKKYAAQVCALLCEPEPEPEPPIYTDYHDVANSVA
jgi:hypothetical protein